MNPYNNRNIINYYFTLADHSRDLPYTRRNFFPF